jgi:Spy/CpxP family protein refolding chaperone
MKNRAKAKWLMVALAMTGVAGGVYAQTSSSSGTATTPAAPGGQHWHHHGGMMGGMLLHSLHQLNLTEQQKQSVHGILSSARTQLQAQHHSAGTANFAALANPGDPNHAAALQDLQSRMAARIQARDQIQQQIYGVLTQDQKTQLASIIAAKQAKMAAHNSAS